MYIFSGHEPPDHLQPQAIFVIIFWWVISFTIPMSSENIYSNILTFYLNGSRVELENPDPDTTLLQYVRSVGLTGTKLGCAEGGCGACTVMVSSYDKETQKISHSSVNACLAPLISVDGKHVITIEGIGNSKNPHPAQERIALSHGSQCGFCTPGITMSLYALLRNNPSPTEHEIEESFDGNLCRCTGYRPILEAAKTFAVPQTCCKSLNGGSCSGCANSLTTLPSSNGCLKADCCQNRTNGVENNANGHNDSVKFPPVNFKKYDPTQEIIFPPSLMKYEQKPLVFKGLRRTFYRPTNIPELLELKLHNPKAKIIAGNTETGIEIKFKRLEYPISIYVGDIPELKKIVFSKAGITVGANLTLSVFQSTLERARLEFGSDRAESFEALLENLRWFAGNQIRNVATLAGNIVTASPISDLNPVLVATKSILTYYSSSKGTDPLEIPLADFFLGYRSTALPPDGIVTSVFIPATQGVDSLDTQDGKFEFVRAYKQARRKDDDIALVNAGIRVCLERTAAATYKVVESSIAFGGMGPTTVSAHEAVRTLTGKEWGNPEVLEAVLEALERDMPLGYASPGGMPQYRKSVAAGFFYRFWCDIAGKLGINVKGGEDAAEGIGERTISSSLRDGDDYDESKQYVGKSLPHLAGMKQVTGEAQYTDDIPKQAGELYGALVMSQRAHARILSVDPSEALRCLGVHAYVGHRDVPGDNIWGAPIKEEEFFASSEVHFFGQTIGVIVAETQEQAQRAARLVKIQYEDLPHILTMEEAIEKGSFLDRRPFIKRGDVDKGFGEADFVFEGEYKMGGQEHFYLETQACLVIPKPEDDEMEIWSSTQNPTECQLYAAEALGIPGNRVVCRVKRLGGGFGGKETRSIALSTVMAVAARKVRRPIRCMLDRDEDMITSGQRHPFMGRWKVGVKEDGMITAYEADIYCNGGFTADLSLAVLERSLTHSDNCYWIPNVHVRGYVCRTNIASNTAFRGFGGPQGMWVTESWMEEIADNLKIPVWRLREINMYKEGQLTHFKQELEDWHVPILYEQVKQSSDFEKRRIEVDTFNQHHRWRKRGISIIPTKFGISFTFITLNQAGALVHIYHDGSIILTHGGVEMGQGLHTKMIQICAETLEVPIEAIHISETATDKVANTSSTAASASSDLNGYAIQNACLELKKRLAPFRDSNPEGGLAAWVKAAYLARVNLTAQGFYKTPEIGYDWEKGEGKMFFYFTQGVAVSEVEIDVLTGQHTVLRTDIMMDVGRTINYAIDIGQIEGAFVQGQGLFTLEETVYFPNGQPFTRGPGNYKIPGFRDIPQDFRVRLLTGVEWKNLRTVQRSKGIGEPPLFLGSSIFFAIRDAIKAARADAGITETVKLESPATAERIKLACADVFVSRSKVVKKDGEKAFFVFV